MLPLSLTHVITQWILSTSHTANVRVLGGGGRGASSANVRVWGGGGASSVTDTCHHTVDSINISYYHWQELPQVSFLSCLS